MITIEADGATEAYVKVLRTCSESNVPFGSSRVGPARDLGAAALQLHGSGRLAVAVGRRLNPFFALAESLWVLRGDRDLRSLQQYIGNYGDFSDDGRTLHGAYGFRLRRHFGVDQLKTAVTLLRESPDTRRVVLQMWSVEDLGAASRDIPCNTQIALKIRGGALDLTVFNRSNDAYLGVPYNMWVFGMVQAYLARRLEVQTGRQTHFIDSLHIYERDLKHAHMVADANDARVLRRLSDITTDDLTDIVSDDVILSGADDFEAIQHSLTRGIMAAHALRTAPAALAELRLPHTQLGLAAYLWIREGRAGDAMRRDDLFEPFVSRTSEQ
jgi:thymidylate synthase